MAEVGRHQHRSGAAWIGRGQARRPLLAYPHYHPGGAAPYGAVRAGDWRLVEFYEDAKVELFNLEDDLGETKDLASSMPERRDELLARLRVWRKEVGAQMPTPNPNYDPARAHQGAGAGEKGKAKKAKP